MRNAKKCFYKQPVIAYHTLPGPPFTTCTAAPITVSNQTSHSPLHHNFVLFSNAGHYFAVFLSLGYLFMRRYVICGFLDILNELKYLLYSPDPEHVLPQFVDALKIILMLCTDLQTHKRRQQCPPCLTGWGRGGYLPGLDTM